MVFEGSALKALIAAGTVAAAGWGAHEYLTTTYAATERLLVAEAQVQYILDRQQAAVTREIAYLTLKKNKTEEERELLKLLREQLKEMREVRKGKQ